MCVCESICTLSQPCCQRLCVDSTWLDFQVAAGSNCTKSSGISWLFGAIWLFWGKLIFAHWLWKLLCKMLTQENSFSQLTPCRCVRKAVPRISSQIVLALCIHKQRFSASAQKKSWCTTWDQGRGHLVHALEIFSFWKKFTGLHWDPAF